MQLGARILHISLEKISRLFKGKGKKLNKKILQTLALKGPMTTYEIFDEIIPRKKDGTKDMAKYPTVNRRIKALMNDGYIKIAGEKTAEKTKQKIPIYGLTLRGAVLSLLLVDYDKPNLMRKLLKNNKETVPFFEICLKLMEKARISHDVIKNIFLDGLKEYLLKGLINIDIIDSYTFLKFASVYIRHRSQTKYKQIIEKLDEQKREAIANSLFQLKKLSDPEAANWWYRRYFAEFEKQEKQSNY